MALTLDAIVAEIRRDIFTAYIESVRRILPLPNVNEFLKEEVVRLRKALAEESVEEPVLPRPAYVSRRANVPFLWPNVSAVMPTTAAVGTGFRPHLAPQPASAPLLPITPAPAASAKLVPKEAATVPLGPSPLPNVSAGIPATAAVGTGFMAHVAPQPASAPWPSAAAGSAPQVAPAGPAQPDSASLLPSPMPAPAPAASAADVAKSVAQGAATVPSPPVFQQVAAFQAPLIPAPVLTVPQSGAQSEAASLAAGPLPVTAAAATATENSAALEQFTVLILTSGHGSIYRFGKPSADETITIEKTQYNLTPLVSERQIKLDLSDVRDRDLIAAKAAVKLQFEQSEYTMVAKTSDSSVEVTENFYGVMCKYAVSRNAKNTLFQCEDRNLSFADQNLKFVGKDYADNVKNKGVLLFAFISAAADKFQMTESLNSSLLSQTSIVDLIVELQFKTHNFYWSRAVFSTTFTANDLRADVIAFVKFWQKPAEMRILANGNLYCNVSFEAKLENSYHLTCTQTAYEGEESLASLAHRILSILYTASRLAWFQSINAFDQPITTTAPANRQVLSLETVADAWYDQVVVCLRCNNKPETRRIKKHTSAKQLHDEDNTITLTYSPSLQFEPADLTTDVVSHVTRGALLVALIQLDDEELAIQKYEKDGKSGRFALLSDCRELLRDWCRPSPHGITTTAISPAGLPADPSGTTSPSALVHSFTVLGLLGNDVCIWEFRLDDNKITVFRTAYMPLGRQFPEKFQLEVTQDETGFHINPLRESKNPDRVVQYVIYEKLLSSLPEAECVFNGRKKKRSDFDSIEYVLTAEKSDRKVKITEIFQKSRDTKEVARPSLFEFRIEGADKVLTIDVVSKKITGEVKERDPYDAFLLFAIFSTCAETTATVADTWNYNEKLHDREMLLDTIIEARLRFQGVVRLNVQCSAVFAAAADKFIVAELTLASIPWRLNLYNGEKCYMQIHATAPQEEGTTTLNPTFTSECNEELSNSWVEVLHLMIETLSLMETLELNAAVRLRKRDGTLYDIRKPPIVKWGAVTTHRHGALTLNFYCAYEPRKLDTYFLSFQNGPRVSKQKKRPAAGRWEFIALDKTLVRTSGFDDTITTNMTNIDFLKMLLTLLMTVVWYSPESKNIPIEFDKLQFTNFDWIEYCFIQIRSQLCKPPAAEVTPAAAPEAGVDESRPATPSHVPAAGAGGPSRESSSVSPSLCYESLSCKTRCQLLLRRNKLPVKRVIINGRKVKFSSQKFREETTRDTREISDAIQAVCHSENRITGEGKDYVVICVVGKGEKVSNTPCPKAKEDHKTVYIFTHHHSRIVIKQHSETKYEIDTGEIQTLAATKEGQKTCFNHFFKGLAHIYILMGLLALVLGELEFQMSDEVREALSEYGIRPIKADAAPTGGLPRSVSYFGVHADSDASSITPSDSDEDTVQPFARLHPARRAR